MCFCPCRTKIFGLVAFSTQTFFFSPRLHFSRLTPHGNLVQLGKTRAKVYSWKQLKNRWTSLSSTQEAQRRQTGRWDRFGRTASTAGGGTPHPPTSKSTVVALQGFSCIRTITGFQFSPAKIRVNLCRTALPGYILQKYLISAAFALSRQIDDQTGQRNGVCTTRSSRARSFPIT